MHNRLLNDDLADFHRIMAVNVLGVMAGTRDAARHMSKAAWRVDSQSDLDRRNSGRMAG